MMKNAKKFMPFGYLLGALMMSSELSAATSGPTIYWVPNAQAVPLSTTSLMILAALFMIVGAWLLPKSKGYAQKISLVAILVLGTYGFTDRVFADSTPYDMTTTRGSTTLIPDGTTTLVNKNDSSVKISAITDLGSCSIVSNTCTIGKVLNKDDSCQVSIICSEG